MFCFNYSQTPLIRPSLIRLSASPAKNPLEQIFPYSNQRGGGGGVLSMCTVTYG